MSRDLHVLFLCFPLTFCVGDKTTPQGILTAFLVTCNCRVLKLYTVPRHKQQQHQQKYVLKKGCYRSLRDCEKGQYGVLSITNPNYDASAADDQPATDNDEDVDIFKSDFLASQVASSSVQHPLQIWSSSTSQEVISGDIPVDPIGAGFSDRNHGGNGGALVLVAGQECDKSPRIGRSGACGTHTQLEPTAGDRILTSRTIKSGEDNEGGGGARVAPAAPDVVLSGCNNERLRPHTNGKLSGALDIGELERRPLPSAV